MKKSMTMVLLLLCGMTMPAMAESKEMRAESPHEVRIGIGDDFFGASVRGLDYGYSYIYVDGKRVSQPYTNVFQVPNLFAEYQYRINHWLGIGLQVNTCWLGWTKHAGDVPTKMMDGHIEIMPTLRFTYFHHEWVNLYSSVSLGYYGGIERQGKSVNYVSGIGFDFCAIGVSVGKNHFFGTCEAGMLNAGSFSGGDGHILSRILSFSLGYRF